MGAWETHYYYDPEVPLGSNPDSVLSYVVKSIQRDLKLNDKYTGELDGVYGPLTRASVVAFQQSKGLLADGVVGPVTAGRLVRKRLNNIATDTDIDAKILCGLVKTESNFDYGATGYADPRDRGLVQINSYWHPDVQDSNAFNGAFALRWAADYLANSYKIFNDWDCAIASYNLGVAGARTWCKTKTGDRGRKYVDSVKRGC